MDRKFGWDASICNVLLVKLADPKLLGGQPGWVFRVCHVILVKYAEAEFGIQPHVDRGSSMCNVLLVKCADP